MNTGPLAQHGSVQPEGRTITSQPVDESAVGAGQAAAMQRRPLQSTRLAEPRRTQRPWGWFETLSEQPNNKVKRIFVEPGHQLSLQKHAHRAEHWVVVEGRAQILVGAQQLELGTGQHIDIPLGEVHRLSNPTSHPVQIIEVQLGTYLGEDDIVRLDDVYGRS